jgi:molybdate transport system ATP-binding protein
MGLPGGSPLIELEDVRVVLGGETVLEAVSWQLREGEHWLVSGPNGAGKTTLLRVIRGDQPIVHGIGRRRYNLVGDDDSPATVKARIGYLSPEFHERLLRLELPLTARELILGGLHGTLYLAGSPTRQERERALQLAEMLELTSILEAPMIELSFGQLRRTLLARALANSPRVLVLDEFAHGIDRHSRALIQEALTQAVREGTALVLATHRSDELPPAMTHELRLNAGRVLASGPIARVSHRSAAKLGRNGGVGANGADDGALIVRLENVDVYQEHRRVLHAVNWEIREGQHWLVSGPNGAGKTTLAKLLYGRLRAAYGGTIERFGPHANGSLAEIRRGVALVSDEEQLRQDWNIPVEAVVASGFFHSVGVMQAPTIEQMRTVRALLDDFELTHLRRRPFLELSFGQRRIVLVARALVRKPRLLILDEALNGLDREVRASVLRRIESLAAEECSVVVIGHHEADVPEWIENELRIENGRIAFSGRRALRLSSGA